MGKWWLPVLAICIAGTLLAQTRKVTPNAGPGRAERGAERTDRDAGRTRWTVPPAVPTEGGTAWRAEQPLPAPLAAFDPDAPELDVRLLASAAPPAGGDLDATMDAQITQEITDLAERLGSVGAIYEHVRNEMEFQPYFGSRKGSVETLRQRSGNDYDLASLLIALLRAQGTPARYAEGVVEMDAETAASWLAVDDAVVAGSILHTRGIEAVRLMADELVGLRARRIWVEAYTANGAGEPGWIPLDPAFKRHEIRHGTDVADSLDVDAGELLERFLTMSGSASPLALLRQEITDHLAEQYPGVGIEEVPRRAAILPEHSDELSPVLPYIVRSRDAFFSVIPDDRRYRIRIHAHDGPAALLDHTLSLPEIAGRRLTLSWEGASAADRATIESHRGLFFTPPAGLRIRPLLKVDGTTVAAGGATAAGRRHDSDIHFLAPLNDAGLPKNPVPSISNRAVAGAMQAIGLAAHGATDPLFVFASDGESLAGEGFIARERHAVAMDYLGRGLVSDRELGDLLHARLFGDVSSAIVKDDLRVTRGTRGNVLAWEWSGLTVDADRRVVGSWRADRIAGECGAEDAQLNLLSSAGASLHQGQVLEQDFAQEAISAIELLQLAAARGVTLHHRWSELPLPPNRLPVATVRAIRSAILDGKEVTFPADTIRLRDWEGAATIVTDPCTGAATFLLSGGLNGGSTVDEWVDIPWADSRCTLRAVEGRVTSPALDAPDSGALFLAQDRQPLQFEYELRAAYLPGFGCPQAFGPWTSRALTSVAPERLGSGDFLWSVGDEGGSGEQLRELTVFDVRLAEVSYGGNHALQKDDGSGIYEAPHWSDDGRGGKVRHPLAFTRGSTMSAAAGFELQPEPASSLPFLVRASGPEGLDLEERATATSGATLGYPMTQSAGTFGAGAARGGEPLLTRWEVSIDGGRRFVEVGVSDNLRYLTLDDPVALPVFHTVMQLAAEGGHGAASPAEAIAGIWEDFADREVLRADGARLSYYGEWTTRSMTTGELLASGDGQCTAWVKLFLDTLKAQGIDQADDYVDLRPEGASGQGGLMIKEWSFAGSGSSGFATFPYLNIAVAPWVPTRYAWMYSEVGDTSGHAGQGSVDPASLFKYHQVARIDGVYYDPSYGRTYGSLAEIDSVAIDGYYEYGVVPVAESNIGVDLNLDGDTSDQFYTVGFVIRPNGPELDLMETILDY